LTVLYTLAFIMILGTAGKEVQERFMSIRKSDMDESAQSRMTTWKIAFRMMKEKPVLGYGIRNSQLFTFAYGADIEGRAIHSQYLQTGADSGVVALALYLALLASVIFGLWRTRRFMRPWQDPETERIRGLVSGLECGMIAFIFGAALMSLQLGAITRAIQTKLGPAGLALAASAPSPRPPAVPAPNPEPASV
jgi:O-antigen ligase